MAVGMVASICALVFGCAALVFAASPEQALAKDRDICAPGSDTQCAADSVQLLQRQVDRRLRPEHERLQQEKLLDQHVTQRQQQQHEQRDPPQWPAWLWPPPAKPRAPVTPLVHAVYTFGAPATHDHAPLRNGASADGCFPGLRSYTEDIKGAFSEIHQVDAAAMNNYYPHARTPSVVLRWQADSIYTTCNATQDGHPDWPQRGGSVFEEWRLHQEDDYTDRLENVKIDDKEVKDEEPFKSARFFVALAYKTYDSVANMKASIAEKMPGWKLVGHVVDHGPGGDEDPVLVAQDSETHDCAIAFTGTNDFGELATSTTQYGTGYCGFEDVHVGYRNELWTITRNLFDKVKPVLESCNKVTCVGHSLGGALCELFAACANSGNYTDPDYIQLAWNHSAPTRELTEVDE